MMSRGFLFAAGGIIILAVSAPKFLEGYVGIQGEQEAKGAALPVTKQNTAASAPSAGTVTLTADERGHYAAKLKINGKQIEGLIDTGASLVAFDERTAKRLGYVIKESDYKYQTSTANGVTSVAVITLDRVELGNIVARDVQATVSKDGRLNTVLIGMSFLKQLKSFKSENGKLILTR
jgi:aspartyl protease family protein